MRRLTTILAAIGLLFASSGIAYGSQPGAVSGTYSVTTITSFSLSPVGANTFIQQTTAGVFSGTLAGTFEDELKAIVHPNGLVAAQGTLTCVCTIIRENPRPRPEPASGRGPTTPSTGHRLDVGWSTDEVKRLLA